MSKDKSAEIESQNRIKKAKDAMRKEGDGYRNIKRKWDKEIAKKGFILKR